LGVLFGDILLDELGFGAELDAQAVPQLEQLVRTVVAIAPVVSVLESEAVLGCLDEQED